MATNKFLRIASFLLVLFYFIGKTVIAQNAAGPFDLLPRIPSTDSDSLISISVSKNPFDIIRISYRRDNIAPTSGFTVEKSKRRLSIHEKETRYKRFVLFTIIISLVYLTLIVTIFRYLIEKIWNAFLSDNLMNQLLREQNSELIFAYNLLYVLFFINAGIFLFLALRQLGLPMPESNLLALLKSTGAVVGFFLFKHLMLWVIGVIFPVQKEISIYQFTIVIFNIITGFLLGPAILFLAYSPQPYSTYTMYFTFGILLLIQIYLVLRSLFIANRFIVSHKFHFLLYLCTVEIIPLLMVVKLALRQG